MAAPESLSRRRILGAVLATGALAACSRGADPVPPVDASGASTSAAPTSEVTPPPAPSSTSSSASPGPASTALPVTRGWTARRGEVDPWVKRQATTLVESVAAWTRSEGDAASARARAAAAGFDPGLVDGLAPLLGQGTDAVVQVRDAQYGGILSGSASVLLVVDQWRLMADGALHAGGTTLDVRLVSASPRWRVTQVLPARTAARTARTRTARQVLGDARIRLPYAARADVAAGSVHDPVLTVLLSLAATHVVDVSVLRSGHPLHVFGTSRTSDHTRGRAVDVWALDGRPLVVPTNHGLAARAMEQAVARGAYNVGGPVLLNGSEYFSDRTHQDHIHLGFRG